MEIFYHRATVCFFNTCSSLLYAAKKQRAKQTNQPTNQPANQTILLLFKRFNGRSLCLSLCCAMGFFSSSFRSVLSFQLCFPMPSNKQQNFRNKKKTKPNFRRKKNEERTKISFKIMSIINLYRISFNLNKFLKR